jgi:RNA polymerase sigma-70 factor (ECF subfamily)
MTQPINTTLPREEQQLIEQLRRGDESAFISLVESYQPSMMRVALLYVHETEVAEEVVQETWVGVLRGLNRFEGRSSVKTWVFSILTNSAKTRAQREGRTIPFSAFDELESGDGEPSVDPSRFQNTRDPDHWSLRPESWDGIPETQLLSKETLALVHQAIEALPPNQRTVITFRDVDGWSAEEVCNVLGISETNQRVLLHRARSSVRNALEHYLEKRS